MLDQRTGVPRTPSIGLPAALTLSAAFVCLGWLVAHGSTRAALALAGLPLGVFVLSRSQNRLLLGTAMIIVLPWWLTFGAKQMKVSVVAPALAVSAMLGAAALETRRTRRSFNFIDLAFCSFVAASLISLAFEGPYTYRSVSGFVLGFFPLGFYVAARRFGGEAWRPLCWVLVAAGSIASLSLLYEFFVAHRPVFENGTYLWSGGQRYFRPGGVFGGPPQAVAALSMVALSSLALLVTTTGARRRVVWLCLAFLVAGIIVTFTRAGMIGFAFGAVIFVTLWRPAALRRLVFTITTVSLVFALVVLPQLGRTSWFQKGVNRHGTLADREVRWTAAWPLITNSTRHLLVGHGVNSLLVGSPSGLPGTPQADLAAAPIILEKSPHSQYIRTLLEQGLVGLALLLAWLGGAVGKAVGAIRRVPHRDDRPLLAACAAAIVSFLVVSLVDDSLSAKSGLGIVALLTGLIAARCALGTGSPSQTALPPSEDES